VRVCFSLTISLGLAEKGRDYPVKVTGVEVIPDPVIRGEPATFRISASTGNRSQFCYELDASSTN
jgi:hypothetical protein